jgi:hypothetical protein
MIAENSPSGWENGDPTEEEMKIVLDLKQESIEAEERKRGFPPALMKATMDHFQYAAEIRGLGVVEFDEASPCAAEGWVHLYGLVGKGEKELPYPFRRGIDVRLEDIRWIADCPHGS